MDSTLIARGVRGVYIVCRLGSRWWLEERGHDLLQLRGTATSGPFATESDARREAQRIDSTARAGDLSGARGSGYGMGSAVPTLEAHIP